MKKKSDESISSLLIDGQIIARAKEFPIISITFLQVLPKKYTKILSSQNKRTYPTLVVKTITQSSFLQLYRKILKT